MKPLLELCNAAVAVPVMAQACFALSQLTRPVASCNAGSQLLSLDAATVLLELLKVHRRCSQICVLCIAHAVYLENLLQNRFKACCKPECCCRVQLELLKSEQHALSGINMFSACQPVLQTALVVSEGVCKPVRC